MSDVIEQLQAVLDALEAAAPSDGASVVELHRQLARLDAVATRATSELATSGEWSADGARSAAAWLAARCHVPKEVAQRRLHLGRCLRSMPATERAWLAGAITVEHVRQLAEAKDIDGEDSRAAGQVEDRRLHLSPSFQGQWFLDGLGDPVSARSSTRPSACSNRSCSTPIRPRPRRVSGETHSPPS